MMSFILFLLYAVAAVKRRATLLKIAAIATAAFVIGPQIAAAFGGAGALASAGHLLWVGIGAHW